MRHVPSPIHAVAALAAALAVVLAGVPAPRPAEASLIGDPTLTNGAGRFAIEGELDLVFGRDIDPGAGELETDRLLVGGSYGFARNVDGFFKVGLFDGDDFDLGFGAGAGARADLAVQGDWHFGGLLQLMYFTGEQEVTVPALPPLFPGTTFQIDVDWLELDLAGAASYRGLGRVVPYGGVKLSFVEGDAGGADFDGDDFLGLFGGVSVAFGPGLKVGAELRIIDESAIGFYTRFAF